MKKALLVVWSCAALAALLPRALLAQTIKPDPDPGIPGEGYVDYVGHYGEVLKLQGGWQIDASMHGDVEVINQYSGFQFGAGDSIEEFKPKPEDFVPENFSRYDMIQLLIMPPSMKSLQELKQAKIEDLRASGVGFTVLDDPWTCYGCITRHWSPGSFEIRVSTPYLLDQLYTATTEHLLILTGGVDTPPSSVIMGHYNSMRTALGDWILPEPEGIAPYPSTPREIIRRGISWRKMVAKLFVIWMTVSGFACLLAGILAVVKRWDALRRAGVYLLLFSHIGGLIGGFLGLLCWPFIWFARHFPVVIMTACLFMPALASLFVRLRGTGAARRAIIGLKTWTFVAVTFCGYAALASNWGGDFAPGVPSFAVVCCFVLFGIGGIVFGLLDSPAETNADGRALLALALLFLAAPRTWAQSDSVPIEKSVPNPISGGVEYDAMARLTARGKTRESYDKEARTNLGKAQVLYAYQRVEIKGIWSKEDTNNIFPNLFDKQIEPSHIGDKDYSEVIPDPAAIQSMKNYGKDLLDLHQDVAQQISESAKSAVKELHGKEINEIVAHSWGAEIVYNAILSGAILPPRRLIVAGMPDRDLPKWAALSKYTGTEVVVYTNADDPAAGTARVVGSLVNRDVPSKEFEAQWENACKTIQCNAHQRRAPDPVYKSDYQGKTHNRLAYYQVMLKDGTIPADQADAKELGVKQQDMIDAERDRLYGAAVDREVQTIQQEQAAGDAGFLSGLKDIQSLAEDSKRTLTQDIHEDEKEKERAAQAEAYRVAHQNDADDAMRAAQEARKTAAYNYIKAAAGLACAKPSEFSRQIDQGKVVGVCADIDSVTLRLKMDDDQNEDGWKSLSVHLNSCQEDVIQQLIHASGPVPSRTLVLWASQYRRQHPALSTRFATSLGDFFKALGDFLGSVGDTDGDPLPDTGAASNGVAGNARRYGYVGRYPPTQHSPDSWPSLNQLRGMAGQ